MTDLQTTVEFSVELYKFYNVDLFQRGYYQIRTSLRVSPKYTSKIEVSLSNVNIDRSSGNNITSSQIVFPSCVVTGTAVSKTFQILYRNEEVVLNDVILFRVHLIVDSRKIEDSLLKADFQMTMELWFTEQPFGPDHHNSIQCVSARMMKLHLCPLKGLHHHLPVLFDYFHLSAVTLTIHGCLLAIHQPYMNAAKPGKPAWLTNSPKVGNRFQASTSLESVLFGNIQGMKMSPSLTRLNQARCIHQTICTILLSSHESLQSKLVEYMNLLPPWQRLHIEITDCCAKLKKLKELSKNVEAEDELLAIVNSDIAQLCAENIILWQQFLECFTLKDRIQQHLTREHHVQRVKRFAEGFFVVENSRQAIFHCAEQSYQTYLSISDSIRKTKYFSSLPSLSVECPDLDGNAETLPVIFEDHYQDMSHGRSGSGGGGSILSKRTPSAISVHDIGFDVTSVDEATAMLHKRITSDSEKADENDGGRRRQRRKSKPLPTEDDATRRPEKTVGCFSTGIVPKSSVSSEDLYYVGNGVSKRKVNQSYRRKGASLPRDCAASALVDQRNDKEGHDGSHRRPPNPNGIAATVFGGPKTSASAEQIVAAAERFVAASSDNRFFRITSSAAVPKYVRAKRKEAFRASGGSKSLSAVEECSRTLPKDHRSNAFLGPKLDTDCRDRCSRRLPLTTSNSMDHAVPSKHGPNGLTTTRPSDHQTLDTKRASEEQECIQKLDQFLTSASRSSDAIDKDLLCAKVDVTHCVQNLANATVDNGVRRHRQEDRKTAIENSDVAPFVRNSIEAKDLKDKLKETMRLDLKPVNCTTMTTIVANRKTKDKIKDRRIGRKVRRRLNGGLQSLMNHQQSPATCSTSSDSIIVLTGYKKLEQSESLPIGLTRIGQSDEKTMTKTGNDETRKDDDDDDQPIPEEDIDEDLNVWLDFQGSSRPQMRRNKTRLTRSMPDLSVLPLSSSLAMPARKNKNKSFSTSTWRSKDADSETTTTEVDDPSSGVPNARPPRVDHSHWSSSDSGHRRVLVVGSRHKSPDFVVKKFCATKANDENVSDISKKVVVDSKIQEAPNRGGEVNSSAATHLVKKKKQLATKSNHLLDAGSKKTAWHRASSSSTCSSSSSSSSSTSERSGWVSSQCSSLDESSSDVTKETTDRRLPSSMLIVKMADAVRPSKPKNEEPNTGRSNKPKRRRSRHRQPKQEAKPSKKDASPVQEDRQIYEEIHLPPEEFRDPTPSTVAPRRPSSPISSVDEGEGRSDRRIPNSRWTTGHCPVRRRHVQHHQRCTKKPDGRKPPPDGPDDATTHSSRPPPPRAQPTRTHAMRHQPSRRDEKSTSISSKPIHREPMTAEYLNTKCTILEMFSDTTFCGYAGNSFKSWTSPAVTPTPLENGRREHFERPNPDDDDERPVPAAPPPPKTKIKTSESLEAPSSTTTCTEEEPAARRDESNGYDDSNTSTSVATLVSVVGENTVSFVKAKEDFKKRLSLAALIYSDCPQLASTIPYFHVSEDFRSSCTEGLHLVVCVHGLDGNSADLRLVKTYLELGLPCSNLEFLMSERNQGDTFSDFEKMTDKLVAEILYHIEAYRLSPAKISFIGHSLGNIIIRSALARPQMKPWLGRLHTFLSLSGPHLGTLYNSSGLVNMGLWFMQKWKKSGSLLQLSMKDAADIRRTFLYRLSQKGGLEYFKNILLFGSSQDRYVPIHSARIELCKAALKDTSVQGMAYRDMVHGLLQPVARNPNIVFVRYDVHHALPNTANSLIGRAAHIAVLDSELFIEKFLTVCGLEYFK